MTQVLCFEGNINNLMLNLKELTSKILISDDGMTSKPLSMQDLHHIQLTGVPPEGWHIHNTEVVL